MRISVSRRNIGFPAQMVGNFGDRGLERQTSVPSTELTAVEPHARVRDMQGNDAITTEALERAIDPLLPRQTSRRASSYQPIIRPAFKLHDGLKVVSRGHPYRKSASGGNREGIRRQVGATMAVVGSGMRVGLRR